MEKIVTATIAHAQQTADRSSGSALGALEPAPPATLVIFGATGDLTRRLLVPALVNMERESLIHPDSTVLGIGKDTGDDETLRVSLESFRAAHAASGADDAARADAWAALRPKIRYLQGDFTTDAIYERLSAELVGNAVFYFAVPPRFFGDIVEKLADHGLTRETPESFRRIAIEKPFGHDAASAQALNARILARVAETQVYRIDHFLGKETVQNIMTLRFANMMIEKLWTSDSIDHVQITAAETVDVGTRGSFYDATGALRDMVPNHLFQLLAMVAMEPPISFDAEAVRDEKAKVIRAIRIYEPDEAAENSVRGAYTAGAIGDRTIPAFNETPDVHQDSRTETFVALKLMIDTWRWAGVPFYLRTGKAMSVRDTEVIVTFKPVPFAQFPRLRGRHLPPNRVVIQIQPDEGISMDMLIKRPGIGVAVEPAVMDFRYAERFDIGRLNGYETLLYDIFTGDQTLFQRADAVEAGWRAVQPFLDRFAAEGAPEPYAPGSLGPDAAAELLARDGLSWHDLITR
jgi:glucose-6-phosphate 1-dehydrogenase